MSPVTSGVLPLDMPIEEFIADAEFRLKKLRNGQHYPCFLFKKKLLGVMQKQFKYLPQFRLIYVRTQIEAVLHEFVAGHLEEVVRLLPFVVREME